MAIPTQAFPLSPGTGEQQVAQAVGELGAGVETLGAGLQRREQAIAAQRKAQDTLDAHLGRNLYTPALQAYASQLKTDPAIDYRDAPRLLQEYSDQQVHVLAQRMTPQAAVLFRTAAGDRFTVVQEDMLQYQRARLVGDSKVSLEDAKKQYIEGMLSATTPQDQAQRTVGYATGLQQMIGAGLLSRAQAGLEIADAQSKIGTQQVELAIRTQPEAMMPHLLALADNKPGVEGLPIPPKTELPKLIDETRRQLQANLSQQDQAAQRTEKASRKLQDDNQVALRTRITELPPTPASLSEYDKLLVETNAQAKDRRISENAQGELTTLVRTLRTAAANPPVYDDLKTERDMSRLVQLAERPDDFRVAREALVANISRLKPETWNGFMTKLEARSTSTHYSQDPSYRKGRQVIVEGLIEEAAYRPRQRAAQSEAEDARLRAALEAYDGEIERLLKDPAEGIPGMRRQAETLGRDIRRDYLDRPAAQVESLPILLHGPGDTPKGILDESEAVRLIETQPAGARMGLYRLWQHWRLLQTPDYTQERAALGRPSRR